MTVRETKSLNTLAEALLVAMSLLSVAGCYRLFGDWTFFWRLAACAVGAHVLAIAARRRGWSTTASLALSATGLLVVVGAAMYWSTTVLGIPTPATLGAMRDDLGLTVEQFNAVRAPAPVTLPLLFPAGLFVWWAAFIADWAAFRLRFSFEALVPLASIFVFSSLIGEKKAQIPLTTIFVLLALNFLLVHRIAHQQSSFGWIGREGGDGPGALLRTGVAVIAGAAVLAAIAGPLVPGSRAEPIYSIRPGAGGSGSSRTVTSPLVEIRKRLIDQPNVELFTVRADERAYWRLTALDTFDGNLWSSNGSYDNIDGSLPSGADHTGSAATTQQSFTIVRLESPWLPAAFEARQVDARGTDVTWSSALSTLIVAGKALTADGITYDVTSERPTFDPAQLAAAGRDIPDDIKAQDLPLPSGFSALARSSATEAVSGATTPFAQALALQDWFRNNFTYDLTVDTDNSLSAIDDFLTSRRGYCQQFAGTYAAMARYLGLPARVAVGFTPGDADDVDPSLFHVKGTHAHAWPEVYLGGQGWVPFEPTPGRGIPGAANYTGVADEQSNGDGTGSTTSIPATTQVPGTTAPSGDQTPTTRPISEPEPAAQPGGPGFFATWPGRVLLVLLAVIGLASGYAVAVVAWHRRQRDRRRRKATDPDAQVEVAWDEGVDAVSLLGLVPGRSETPSEFAGRVDPVLDGAPWARLADLVVAAEFSDRSVAADDAAEAGALAGAIDDGVRAQVPTRQRLLAELDPRSRDRRMASRRRRSSTHPPRARRDTPGIEVIEL
ncbi:MAG: DUF3488 and transglutaminase-like domain-containing protein [Acidimicrobiales bacterium]